MAYLVAVVISLAILGLCGWVLYVAGSADSDSDSASDSADEWWWL